VIEDELVTGFDQFGVQRLNEKKKKPEGPLVIPALKNRDWREHAKKRRTQEMFVPPSARAATTGADGSVGGLGTKDTINSGPQIEGLQIRERKAMRDVQEVEMKEVEDSTSQIEETEDQKAIRALLASAASDGDFDGLQIETIPLTEDDAYRQDVEELPDSSTLEDYERVPVSQFGAALLRGMGWTEGTAASKNKKGMVEPWVPQSRPSLLGIGAKEKETFDDGSKRKKYGGKPDKKYMPLVKKERSGDERSSSRKQSPSSTGHSGSGSRRQSRSPSPNRSSSRHRDDDRKRDRGYRDRDSGRDSGRYRDSGREKDRHRDRDYDRHRGDDSDRRRDRSRDRYDGRRKERRD